MQSSPTINIGLIVLGATIFVGLSLIGLRLLGLESSAIEFLTWVHKAGIRGQLIFATVIAIGVVFLFPGIVFTMGAGFLFGVVQGSLLVITAETLGATIALLLARQVKGSKLLHAVEHQKLVKKIVAAPEFQDWRWIALLRSIPFFPFKLSNFALGLTPVSVRTYLVGTFIGLWPITLFNVYLGSIAADLLTLKSTATPKSPEQWAVYGVGFIASICLMLFLAHRAQKTIGTL